MDSHTDHVFPGTVLTDLDADGLPELIVTGCGKTATDGPEVLAGSQRNRPRNAADQVLALSEGERDGDAAVAGRQQRRHRSCGQ